MKKPDSILITGASSGIGAALAATYAGEGRVLAIGGRNADRLEPVADRCRAAGAQVETARIDVTDGVAMAAWIIEADRQAPLDLVIANAGISADTSAAAETRGAGQARRIFAVNVDGVLNTVLPVIPPMRARGHGQIALMSSIAAFRGFPHAPAYCASKAAVKAYGEGLRGSLRGDGIGVSVICPGFVRSPMTAAHAFPMPLIMDAEQAARLIAAELPFPGRSMPWPGRWARCPLPSPTSCFDTRPSGRTRSRVPDSLFENSRHRPSPPPGHPYQHT